MSALARYYNNKWYEISWSDSEDSDLISELKNEWIKIIIGHSESNILSIFNSNSFEWKICKVFYTEAISLDNPELKKAHEIWIECLSYFEWLWEISKQTKCIAISGSHGKSTTTAMVWIIMQELWLKPDVIVWTRVPNFWNKNFLLWNWDYLVVEACEYRESFLHLNVYCAIITNIEADHLDYYKNEDNYVEWFKKFVSAIDSEWFLILNKNDKNSQKIKTFANCRVIEVSDNDESLNIIPQFNTPWEHIRFDWLLAYNLVSNLLNKKIIQALQSFNWTWRRFEYLWMLRNSIQVISDYAHHPTEIQVTLKWAKERFLNKKIICVFEPHQYSRTIELFDDFCKSFYSCDVVVIPSIYKVRDKQEDIDKISSRTLSNWINNYSKNAISVDWENELNIWLKENLKWNEILIFMWAWPIDNFARKIIKLNNIL